MTKSIVVTITLASGVDAAHALDVVDHFLADGPLQDAINQCECDKCHEGTRHYLDDEDAAARVTGASAVIEVSPKHNDCDCENGGALRGFLHIDNSDSEPWLGRDGQHIERCDACGTLPDDDAARAAHARECGCGWGDRLLPSCPTCGDDMEEQGDCMRCSCGYRIAMDLWRRAYAEFSGGHPWRCDCERCRPELHAKG